MGPESTDMGRMVADKAPSVIPSHDIATWIMRGVNDFLSLFGLENSSTAQQVVYIVVVAAVALIIGLGIKTLLLWITRKIVALRKSHFAQEILREGVLAKCFHVVPPLVFMALIPFAFNSESGSLHTIMTIVGLYALIAFAVGLNAILTFAFDRYNERINRRNLPLKGILNVAKGIVWIIIAIIAVSILVDKSPMALLAGLGAFAAALMLIFKDSILGFVAGIQMSQNDMLHVGDWIVVPNTPANGTVMDVSLTAVKVQNWDNTIVTVPPYTLVSGAFQNWRGMSDSGVRRILETFTIDYAGVCACTPALLQAIGAKYPLMAEYISKLQGDTGDGGWSVDGGLRPVNGTVETNVGLFRAYLCLYLMHNPHISKEQRILVQMQEPNIYGLQLQIWCFTNTTDFNAYCGILAGVVEHVASVVSDFGLQIYTSSSETITLAKTAARQ